MDLLTFSRCSPVKNIFQLTDPTINVTGTETLLRIKSDS